MPDREKLIELIVQSTQKCDSTDCNRCKYWNTNDCSAARMADILLKNGVIVPPCKVHDLVYDLVLCDDKKYRIFDMRVGKVVPFGSNYNDDVWNVYLIGTYTYAYRSFYDFGKTVFLTREEAEKALKERETE